MKASLVVSDRMTLPSPRPKNVRVSAAILSLLSAPAALASFGAGSVGFMDRFFLFGLVFGVVGIPVMAIALAVVNVLARSKHRSRAAAAAQGAVFGCVAWIIASAVTAAGMQMHRFPNGDVPMLIGIATLIICAIASAIYVRFAPAAKRRASASRAGSDFPRNG